jgi:uncharacterized membrane protein
METSVIDKQEAGSPLTLWLPKVSIVLAIIGLLDSIYLAWLKLAGTTALCGGVGDCESVNNSIYAEINGIPIALLGAGAYLLIMALLLVEGRFGLGTEWPVMGVFGLSLIGTLYSVYLTYLEVAVLHAICPYCVLSAIAIALILVISVIRLRQQLA